MLSEKIGRGSLECTISLKQTGNAKPVSINTDLAKAYYKALSELSAELNLDPSHILSTLVKMPEVITPTSDTLTDDEWQQFETVIVSAIDDLNMHRLDEGKILEESINLFEKLCSGYYSSKIIVTIPQAQTLLSYPRYSILNKKLLQKLLTILTKL